MLENVYSAKIGLEYLSIEPKIFIIAIFRIYFSQMSMLSVLIMPIYN
jgi:hypothetical protein